MPAGPQGKAILAFLLAADLPSPTCWSGDCTPAPLDPTAAGGLVPELIGRSCEGCWYTQRWVLVVVTTLAVAALITLKRVCSRAGCSMGRWGPAAWPAVLPCWALLAAGAATPATMWQILISGGWAELNCTLRLLCLCRSMGQDCARQRSGRRRCGPADCAVERAGAGGSEGGQRAPHALVARGPPPGHPFRSHAGTEGKLGRSVFCCAAWPGTGAALCRHVMGVGGRVGGWMEA